MELDMNIKRVLVILALSATQYGAIADDLKPNQFERDVTRTQEFIEKAMAQAYAQQSKNSSQENKTGLNINELKQMQGVDPQKLAAHYQQSLAAKADARESLLIFVSTSMPMKALVMLGEQAKVVGATLVIRGLVAPLGTKLAMQKTMEALQPVAATGAKIQIDPEAFGRYNVKSVPTFVIASTSDKTCAVDQCDGNSSSVSGDVTLEYALDHLANRGGVVSQQANQYLMLLERAKE